MTFFFVVIAGLSILSAYHLNQLSGKTEAILKENHFSVIFARNMAEGLTALNEEMTRSRMSGSAPDPTLIAQTVDSFEKSLQLEKNNFTEVGEDKLVAEIESGFNEYRSSIAPTATTPVSADQFDRLQRQFHVLYQQTMLLSRMNEQAIVRKADEAKKSAEKGSSRVTIFATICFIITLSFTFNFASYFNNRFTKLYNGIREIGSSNYSQRLNFEGEDEFYDISLVFNEMAKNLESSQQAKPEDIQAEVSQEISRSQVTELKKMLDQMQGIKERAEDIIAKLEQKE